MQNLADTKKKPFTPYFAAEVQHDTLKELGIEGQLHEVLCFEVHLGHDDAELNAKGLAYRRAIQSKISKICKVLQSFKQNFQIWQTKLGIASRDLGSFLS